MNKILLVLILMFCYGCNNLPFLNSNENDPVLSGNQQNNTTTQTKDDTCPQTPASTAQSEDITLTDSPISKSLKLKSGNVKAYKFEGQSGKIFDHSYDKDICFWVYTPQGNLLDLESSLELPEKGNYLVLMSVAKGSTTVNLEMSLQDKSQPVAKNPPPKTPNNNNNNNTGNNTPPRTSNQTSNNSPRNNFSESEALDIVNGWYSAKSRVFGPSYDRNLASQYLTGKKYNDNLEKDGGGSVGWLQRNNCYYTYEFFKIIKVASFNNSGNRPSLRIYVNEKLQLHGPTSTGCSKNPNNYTKYVTYWFEKDGGTWKIYDRIVD